ncbi:hypothetical protein IWQ60_005594 [Tieghemiomyces parasiticus]|uniref:Uncharacterized protein n=1 Tax=Tieghemiomyces parasiticus TaxID=78921 RepID=A0A9W8A635_9FUNG|nr:hypothetical protein IWQ60_005594 [Tieghemiomyces parasiticus]
MDDEQTGPPIFVLDYVTQHHNNLQRRIWESNEFPEAGSAAVSEASSDVSNKPNPRVEHYRASEPRQTVEVIHSMTTTAQAYEAPGSKPRLGPYRDRHFSKRKHDRTRKHAAQESAKKRKLTSKGLTQTQLKVPVPRATLRPTVSKAEKLGFLSHGRLSRKDQATRGK